MPRVRECVCPECVSVYVFRVLWVCVGVSRVLCECVFRMLCEGCYVCAGYCVCLGC